MIPCWNQWNVYYITRSLRVCRAQKCNPSFGLKTPPRIVGLRRTLFQAAPIGPKVQICGNSRLPITMVRCLHQWNVYIKRKLNVCRTQKCIPCFGAKRPLRSTDLQKTLFHIASYRADSTNLREFGTTYRHDTVLEPMECLLYHKELEGMQSPKM